MSHVQRENAGKVNEQLLSSGQMAFEDFSGNIVRFAKSNEHNEHIANSKCNEWIKIRFLPPPVSLHAEAEPRAAFPDHHIWHAANAIYELDERNR